MNVLSPETRVQRIIDCHNGIRKAQNEAKVQKKNYNNLVLNNSEKIREKEDFVQYEYCSLLTGTGVLFQEQVSVPHGRIDVLTSTEIIEIKYGYSRNKIFQAIGQLSYYSIYYPNHFKKIVITGQPSEQMKKIMKSLFIEWEVFKCSLW